MPPAELARSRQPAMSCFPGRTTEACYDAFPIEVKASCPLQPRKSIDMERTKQGLAAGPVGGARTRPAPAEARTSQRQAGDAKQVSRNKAHLRARGFGSD